MQHRQVLSRRDFLEQSTLAAGLLAGGSLLGARAALAGSTDLCIVLSPGASAPDTQAATELQQHLAEALRAEVPITTALPGAGARAIVLGLGEAANALGVQPALADLGHQGYLLRSAGDHLVIAGTPDGGTLNGVYDFLEKYAGVRWHAPGVTHIPSRDALTLPNVDTTVRPAFRWRHTSYAWPSADAAFLARQHDNQGTGDAAHRFGRQIAHDGRCHTYFRYLSPDDHFDAHPEYFSEIGGVRRRHETQLCLTHPDVLERVTESMLARMDASPEFDQYNFSQMDYYSNCACARCTAMNERYGTPGGTQFWFCNELAARTSAVHPDKLIGTLAYMYTEAPPVDLPIHPNVAVWLCHMFPSCDSHPIATCERNASFKARAERWAALCKHLYIWHYIVDFAHYYNPFPNFRAMAADIRFYRDIGVEGIYLQGMGQSGGGGEFSLLRPYYGMKLLWNPDTDPDELLRDFLQGYHGAAADPIHAYITLLHDEVERHNHHMHLYTNPAQGYLSDEILQRAHALFDQAEAAVAGDETLLERVKVARMPLVYARVFPRKGYTIEADRLVFSGPFAQMAEAQEFVARMQRHGFETLRERDGDPAQMMLLSMLFNAPVPLAVIENAHLRAEAVPFLGGRVLRIAHKPSGRCITANNKPQALLFPFHGGEESRVGGIYDSVGSFSQFTVAQASPNELQLEVQQPGGLRIRRTITLAADQPEITCTTTVENGTDRVQAVTLRSHLDLDLGPLTDLRVQFNDRQGRAHQHDAAFVLAGDREGAHFRDNDTPDGAWTFTGAGGLQVTQRFDNATMDFTWLVAYPAELDTLETELWRKPEDVPPGGAISLAHTLHIDVMG